MKLKSCLLGCILSTVMVSGIVKADPAPQTCEVDYTLDAKAWKPALQADNATYSLRFRVFDQNGNMVKNLNSYDTADIDWTNPVIKLIIPIDACNMTNHITVNSQKDTEGSGIDLAAVSKKAKPSQDKKEDSKARSKFKEKLVGMPGPPSNDMFTLYFYNLGIDKGGTAAITLFDSTQNACCQKVAYGTASLPGFGTSAVTACMTQTCTTTS